MEQAEWRDERTHVGKIKVWVERPGASNGTLGSLMAFRDLLNGIPVAM